MPQRYIDINLIRTHWDDILRLIQNAIVLWNELYLSQKLTMTDDEETKQALLTIIRNGSTSIWHYVNLHGEYDFTQDIEEQDVVRY